MSDRPDFSDELLNALVDEQLAPEDAERIYAQMRQDAELTRRVCDLRTMRDLMRLAYLHPPTPTNSRQTGLALARWSLLRVVAMNRAAIAALIAIPLVLGVVVGWFLHSAGGLSKESIASLEAGSTYLQGIVNRHTRVLFHVSSADPARMKATLDEVENVLNLYRQSGQRVRVEVLSNGPGLNLLRVATSPYPKRIERMMRVYKNLTFVACQNTIDRLRRDEGIEVQLLSGTAVTESGVAEILRRQQQGWNYIQI
jgi:intracellular sulfur oxidation DsrE/DsrF family protein